MPEMSDLERRSTPTEAVSRARRSQDITNRLLDAAVEVFGESGFDAARVHEVARRCDLTIGAVYSRWATKRDLFVDVVEYVTKQRMVFLVNNVEMSTAEKFALLGRNLLSVSSDALRDCMLEASVVARRDEDLRAKVSESLAAEAAALSAMVEEGKASGLIDPSLSTEAVALLCQSLGLGTHVAISTKSDDQPMPTADQWETLVMRLIAAVAPSRPEDLPQT